MNPNTKLRIELDDESASCEYNGEPATLIACLFFLYHNDPDLFNLLKQSIELFELFKIEQSNEPSK